MNIDDQQKELFADRIGLHFVILCHAACIWLRLCPDMYFTVSTFIIAAIANELLPFPASLLAVFIPTLLYILVSRFLVLLKPLDRTLLLISINLVAAIVAFLALAFVVIDHSPLLLFKINLINFLLLLYVLYRVRIAVEDQNSLSYCNLMGFYFVYWICFTAPFIDPLLGL